MKHFPSFWESSVLLRKFDFAILGAGLIGKQISIKLKAKYPSARIALIDRSPISYGASTRNAGFACFGSVSEILDDCKRSPNYEVAALAAKRYKGINQLVHEFGADAIGYRNTGSYEIYRDQDELDEAIQNVDAVNQLLYEVAGIKNAFHWKETANFQMNCFDQCLFNPYEGMINTGMLNEVINAKAHQSGVMPLYGLTIESIQASSDGYDLLASDGMCLQCGQLIVTTNAFTSQLIPDYDITPARGQIILTKPLDKLPFDGIFHNDKGYIYFRNLGDRVLLGGARNHFESQENTWSFEGEDNIKTHLINYMAEVILPGRQFEIETSWTGIMAMGQEKIPIVQRVNEHLCVCVRMSGMGVALGPVLSDEIVALQ